MTQAKSKLPTRRLRQQEQLSVVGMDARALADSPPERARQVLADALDRGLNYIDLPGLSNEGDIEGVVAEAISARRDEMLLAGRTARRDAAGAAADLAEMLRRLGTDHLDLYQFDAVADARDTQAIFAPDGAGKTFLKARAAGQTRMLGFVAHDVPAAMAMMGSFPLDAILVPVNFVCYAQGDFGPQLLTEAGQRDLARLACDSLAYTPWPDDARAYPRCPYRPIDVPQLARQAIRFALGEGVTSLLAPPDAQLLAMTMDCVGDLSPLPDEKRQALLESAQGLEPIFTNRPTGADHH